MLNQTYSYFLGAAFLRTDTSLSKPKSEVWVSVSNRTPEGVGSTRGGIFTKNCFLYVYPEENKILFVDIKIKYFTENTC